MSIMDWLWRAIATHCDKAATFFWQLLYKFRPPITSDRMEAADDQRKPPPSHKCPTALKYHRRQGSWRRKLLPALPDHAFRIPDPSTIPYGEIYYHSKGHFVGFGATSFVDRLETGNIIKYPIPNPYCPEKEQKCRQQMEAEAEAYKRIGDSTRIPRLIYWDASSCCLILEYLEKGDLRLYMERESQHVTAKQKDIWTTQATEALAIVHAAKVIHCDITPRNFLLDGKLNLYLADFAGSSIAGSRSTITTGPRFQRPGWRRWEPSYKDDIFALGSVLYFIQTGHEPYSDRTEKEVETRFTEGDFPDVSLLRHGKIIRSCWEEGFADTQQIVEALMLR